MNACCKVSGDVVFVRDLVLALTRAHVEYCVVGGLAVNLHGARRRTYNVDLVVRPDARNLAALQQLLAELGLISREPIELETLASKHERRRLLSSRNLVSIAFRDPRDALREVDVVVAPPLDASGLVARAVARRCGGISVRVAALADLMLMKRVSGWHGDAGDVARLERVRLKLERRRRSARP